MRLVVPRGHIPEVVPHVSEGTFDTAPSIH